MQTNNIKGKDMKTELYKVITHEKYPNGKNQVRWVNCLNLNEIYNHFGKDNIKSIEKF
tara:strand:- start:371 stop:544 length:174 start_codon:yes stop_codon:yes gene_type:complete